jgi:hypothetical protein
MRFVDKYRQLFLIIFRNLLILTILLFGLELLTPIVISRYISVSVLGFLLTLSIFVLIFFFITKHEKVFKEEFEPKIKYGFLLMLLIITIGSLRFKFIENIGFLSSIVNFISSISYPLTMIAVFLGFLTFYFNQEVIDEV